MKSLKYMLLMLFIPCFVVSSCSTPQKNENSPISEEIKQNFDSYFEVQTPAPSPATESFVQVQPDSSASDTIIPQNSETNQTVYITKSGKKYHKAECYIIKDKAIPTNLSEAEEKGYEPCKKCH